MRESGLDWTIVRPTVLHGDPTEEPAYVGTDDRAPTMRVSRLQVARVEADALEREGARGAGSDRDGARSPEGQCTMGDTEVSEAGRTFEVSPEAMLPVLVGVDGVVWVSPPEERLLETVYFDTPDLALARRGVGLQRRTGGVDAGWYVERSDNRDMGAEPHRPLGERDAEVPDAVIAPVRAFVRDRSLVPIVRVSTRRLEQRVVGHDGALLAGLSDDRVRAERIAGPGATEDGANGGSRSSTAIAHWWTPCRTACSVGCRGRRWWFDAGACARGAGRATEGQEIGESAAKGQRLRARHRVPRSTRHRSSRAGRPGPGRTPPARSTRPGSPLGGCGQR